MDYGDFDDKELGLNLLNMGIISIDIYRVKNVKVRELLIATIFKNDESDIESLSSGS
ncbi:MAG: hypothetical protein ACXAEU_06885 [Candidatus Hodarchaeales archaeon]|jgi:hypothetical protein